MAKPYLRKRAANDRAPAEVLPDLQVREALPPGKEPGGFAEAFAAIFRDEVDAFNARRAACAVPSSASD